MIPPDTERQDEKKIVRWEKNQRKNQTGVNKMLAFILSDEHCTTQYTDHSITFTLPK